MKIRILLILSVLLINSAYSQNETNTPGTEISKEAADVDQIEFAVDPLTENHEMLSLGRKGALVYYLNKGKLDAVRDEYVFILFDTLLREVSRKAYEIPADNQIHAKLEANGKVYFLLAKTLGVLGDPYLRGYSILRFDPTAGRFDKFDGAFSKRGSYYLDFKVVNDIAYIKTEKGASPSYVGVQFFINCFTCFLPYVFGYGRESNKPELVVHNLQTNQQKDFPLAKRVHGGASVLEDYTIDDSTNTCFMTLSYTKGRRRMCWLNTIDKDAALGNNIDIRIPYDYTINNVDMSLYENKKLIYGEYRQNVEITNVGLTKDKNSSGIYFGIIGNRQIENKLNFVSFTSIQGLTGEIYIPKRKMKKLEQGKTLNMNLGVAFAKPVIYNDKIILVGETYTATYRTETYQTTEQVYNSMTKTTSTRWVTKTVQVFDGWNFLNLIFIAFDMNGKMIWSNVVEYSRTKSMNAKVQIKPLLLEDGSVRVVYRNSASVMTVTVDKNGSLSTFKQDRPITLKKNNRFLSSDETTGVVYWYDDLYLAFGKTEEGSDTGKKKKKTPTEKSYYIRRVVME